MSFLQVASWNVEHLSGQPRAARKQAAYALADHIEMAGVDVIALQEIYVTPDDEVVQLFSGSPPVPRATSSTRRNSDLDVVCYLLKEHLDDEWTYLILPNRSEDDLSQLCAVMWNTKRVQLAGHTPLNVQHASGQMKLWDRRPHLLTFKSTVSAWRRSELGDWQKLDETRSFALVPLHMKSNVGGPALNRMVRAAEAKTLCDAVEAIHGSIDPSIIMLGDTNILSNEEPAIETFVTRGFIDLNNNDATTFWSKDFGESPFDRMFVAVDRPEFRYSRQYVLRSSDLQLHDRFLSDHYMIKMSVKDYVDDADPR
jgi:Endonuclease/Exonuclease/phosphatase family